MPARPLLKVVRFPLKTNDITSIKPKAGKIWRILQVNGRIDTDANVASRNFQLFLKQGAAEFYTPDGSTTVDANQIRSMAWNERFGGGIGASAGFDGGSALSGHAGLGTIYMSNTMELILRITNVEAGDTIEGWALVIEWDEEDFYNRIS